MGIFDNLDLTIHMPNHNTYNCSEFFFLDCSNEYHLISICHVSDSMQNVGIFNLLLVIYTINNTDYL